jgi:hypothetical protein
MRGAIYFFFSMIFRFLHLPLIRQLTEILISPEWSYSLLGAGGSMFYFTITLVD